MKRVWGMMLLAMLLTACSKQNAEGGGVIEPDGPVTPGIIKNELVMFDKSFNITLPEKVCWERNGAQIVTPKAGGENLIDLHMEVLPVYAFDAQAASSGDYYAVKGYITVHNGKVFADDEITARNKAGDKLRRCGWYMSDLHTTFQLLDGNGNAVDNTSVSFFVTPQPSTTIGSTTYNKGFTFTLPVLGTVGASKYADPSKGETKPSWKNMLMGILAPGIDWDDSSTQNLPDQSVEMSTDPLNRTVSYSLLTNNVKKQMGADFIPGVARTDQRFDFSFIWHVHGGCYCAKDGDFGNMKLKVGLNPKWKSNIEGDVSYPPSVTGDPGKIHFSNYDDIYMTVSETHSVDLPSINRIPTGKFSVKNTSMRYLTNLTLWREGEYDQGGHSAYNTVSGSYDRNESVRSLTRIGHYDLVYELVDGDGESRGKFIIRGFEVKNNQTTELTTMDGTRL